MGLEAVFFDFDGVIFDTPSHYFRHMKAYLRARNAEISDGDIAGLVGLTFAKKLEFINSRYGLRIDRKEFADATYGLMVKELGKGMRVDADLGFLLAELRSNSVEMLIASNNGRKNIEFFLEKLGVKNFFSGIISFEDVLEPKPHPETYSRALGLCSRNPRNCVAVEDTVIGVESAKGAGLKCVAIPNKFVAMHDFSMADLVVKSFSELNFGVFEGLVK